MANHYDPNPFAEEEEVNPFANPGRIPPASNSRLSPLPPEPVGFDYGRTVDIPLEQGRSGTQNHQIMNNVAEKEGIKVL